MSAHSFPFQSDSPAVALTLLEPELTLAKPATQRGTYWVDTGFTDYLQIDWDTFAALNLQYHTVGTITSELADGSSVSDLVALVRVLIPECNIDTTIRCISNPAYGSDLRLVGNQFLQECQALIDYPQQQTTLSD
ncbi:MAG: hypothetical protein M3347_04045 [Armatimonadota bacterium]|nr:hypothetical protein [Armatimonadota bacterium]